jgi:hypothetical protein
MIRIKKVGQPMKTPRVSGAPIVRQVRGKGMNIGGSDPRPIHRIDPISEGNDQVSTPSYLPSQKFAKGGKVRAMSYGKGSKVISCSCGMK